MDSLGSYDLIAKMTEIKHTGWNDKRRFDGEEAWDLFLPEPAASATWARR